MYFSPQASADRIISISLYHSYHLYITGKYLLWKEIRLTSRAIFQNHASFWSAPFDVSLCWAERFRNPNDLFKQILIIYSCACRSVAPSVKKKRMDDMGVHPIFFRPRALYTDLQQDNIKIQTSRSKPKFIFLLCFFVLTLFLVLSKFCSQELVLSAFIRSKQIYREDILSP